MVQESDIQVYDPNDWEIQVGGVTIVSPMKFEITPEFAGDDQLIESLYGEVGFSENSASSKGTVRISVPITSPSAKYLANLAKARTKVTVENFCRKNPQRYPKTRVGLTYAKVKPAGTTIDKQVQAREFELMGFGYFEDP